MKLLLDAQLRRRAAQGAAALLCGLLAASAGSGCSPSNHASTASEQAAAAQWNWEQYPHTPRMRLALLPCQLQPKSSISIHAPLVGALRIYAASPQTNLMGGTVWAEFEPEIFAAEAQSLEEARIRLEQRERVQTEVEIPRQKSKAERELEEAQRQLALASLVATNQEFAKSAFNLQGDLSVAIQPRAVEKARMDYELAQISMNFLNSSNYSALGIDAPGQRSEWERRKLEFERRRSQAQLKMPFNGQLTVNLPLTEGVSEYPVNAGQEVAVVRDFSQIRLRVPLSNPSWVSLPTERLAAVIRLPHGEELTASFAFQKIEKVQMREESVYYFQFAPEASPMVSRLIGTDVSCELWLNMPSPAFIVPKLSAVLHQPAAFQGKSWAHGVAVAWPGARVAVEGQTDLAIVMPRVASRQ